MHWQANSADPKTGSPISYEEFVREPDSYTRWYNQHRIKLSFGALSPLEYRQQLRVVA
ncbi:IS3 family transposase [Eoetvoesiella caeni]